MKDKMAANGGTWDKNETGDGSAFHFKLQNGTRNRPLFHLNGNTCDFISFNLTVQWRVVYDEQEHELYFFYSRAKRFALTDDRM